MMLASIKFSAIIAATVVLLAGPCWADSAIGAQPGLVVDVSFSKPLAEDMRRLNRVERKREAHFRKYKAERRQGGLPRLSRRRYAKTEFGGERLIGEIDDFSFENIIVTAVSRAVEGLNLSVKPARVSVHISKIAIENFSVAKYRGLTTYMQGRVEIFDEDGQRTEAVKLTWEMVPFYTTDLSYTGREYVFLQESAYVRIVPLAVGFVEKALEYIYKGSDVPGPLFILPPHGASP